MNANELIQKFRSFANPQNLIIMLAVSAFLPYVFTLIFAGIAFVIIMVTPQYQRGLFSFRGAFFIPVFSVYAFVVAFFNHNKLGVIIAPVFFLILMTFCFVRKNITRETFETCISAVCFTVFPSFITAVIEYFTVHDDNGLVYRCSSYYGNANWFGALTAAIIIICAYKIVDSHGKALFYYIVGFVGLMNIYLSGSLFAIIEIIVGVAAYLLFSKHYRLFCLMIIVGSLGIILITGIPELLPRLSESTRTTDYRVRIWGIAIREIKNHPFFGRGFMSYNIVQSMYEGSYPTVHGHNLMIDSLMNFGIVGTVLLFAMFYYILRRVVMCFFADKNSTVITVIISVCLAVLAHSFTDITFFWVQTGLFYVIVLGAVGAEERRLNIVNDTLIFGKYRF